MKHSAHLISNAEGGPSRRLIGKAVKAYARTLPGLLGRGVDYLWPVLHIVTGIIFKIKP